MGDQDEQESDNADSTISDTVRNVLDIREEYFYENERVTVIVASSRMESLLGKIISGYLLSTPDSEDKLLEGRGALSTFSARIRISNRLGLIDDELARTLHLTRKTRNSFAHEVSSAFEEGEHKNRVQHIFQPIKEHMISKLPEDGLPAFNKFTLAAEAVLAVLETRAKTVKTLTDQQPATLRTGAEADLSEYEDFEPGGD